MLGSIAFRASIAACIGLPLYKALSGDSHRHGIERQFGRTPADSSHGEQNQQQEVQEEAPVAFNQSHYPKGLNAGFLNRDKAAAVEFYTPKFEDPECRDIAANKELILDSVGSIEGEVVLDVGSGTGFFLQALSKRVGSAGLIIATDLAASMCDRMRERIQEEQLPNVTVFQTTEKSLGIPRSLTVDTVLICDVYHHLTFPKTFMRDIRNHMRPGGKLVLIDFHRNASKMLPGGGHQGDWVMDHVRAGKAEFVQEITESGFRVVDDVDGSRTGLTENYMVVFESTKEA